MVELGRVEDVSVAEAATALEIDVATLVTVSKNSAEVELEVSD